MVEDGRGERGKDGWGVGYIEETVKGRRRKERKHREL